jgi:hypothetical protein
MQVNNLLLLPGLNNEFGFHAYIVSLVFKSITLIPIFVCKPEDWIIEFMELCAFL